MNTKAHWMTAVSFGLALAVVGGVRLVASYQAVASIAGVVDEQVSNIENLVVGVAEAMPEEKYGFVPTNGEFTGVKSFADQLKHIADDNYGGYASAVGEKPPADSNAGHITSKAEILTYLRGSFAMAHRAAATLTTENIVTPIPGQNGGSFTRLEVIVGEIGHANNHYGQLVEYLRMNGIIPPASRPQAR